MYYGIENICNFYVVCKTLQNDKYCNYCKNLQNLCIAQVNHAGKAKVGMLGWTVDIWHARLDKQEATK